MLKGAESPDDSTSRRMASGTACRYRGDPVPLNRAGRLPGEDGGPLLPGGLVDARPSGCLLGLGQRFAAPADEVGANGRFPPAGTSPASTGGSWSAVSPGPSRGPPPGRRVSAGRRPERPVPATGTAPSRRGGRHGGRLPGRPASSRSPSGLVARTGRAWSGPGRPRPAEPGRGRRRGSRPVRPGERGGVGRRTLLEEGADRVGRRRGHVGELVSQQVALPGGQVEQRVLLVRGQGGERVLPGPRRGRGAGGGRAGRRGGSPVAGPSLWLWRLPRDAIQGGRPSTGGIGGAPGRSCRPPLEGRTAPAN